MLWEELGKKKKRARGARWEGLFPLPIVPRALSIFWIIAIFIVIPSGSLCGGESHLKVPLERFYLNGHTVGFRPRIQKLEPSLYCTLSFTSGVEG